MDGLPRLFNMNAIIWKELSFSREGSKTLDIDARNYVDAVILAGGKSSRMGGRHKGNLICAEETFTKHMLNEVSKVADHVWISYGKEVHEKYEGCEIIQDKYLDCGPIGGIHAGLSEAKNEKVIIEDKEEILSDTFFILWKNRKLNILSLSAYLAGIVKNLAKEKLRKKKITYDISDYENIIDYSHLDVYTDERDKINECISFLKEQDQNIFNMFYYSAKSIKEISKELNISEFNVSTRLYRIRKKIQKESLKLKTLKKTLIILKKTCKKACHALTFFV